MQADIQSLAKGQWPRILEAAGVDPAHLDGKHHPCPACGGRDRFRFDNLNDRGTFFCGHCTESGAGDGFTLLQNVLSTDFPGAVSHVERVLGIQREPKTPPKPIPPRPLSHKREGTPSAVWEYADKRGTPVFWVYRFDGEDGKKTYRPLHWSGKEWSWKDPPVKLPLYRLDKIHAAKGAPLLFAEGEKASDAAAVFFQEHICTGTAHGAQSPGKSDFAPVKGRPCLIWPDADAAGAKYADTLAELLHAAGASQVEILQLPEGLPPKADAADMAGLDVSPEQVMEWARRPWKPAEEVILTTGARLSDLSEKGLQALRARNNPAHLFVQSGRLVRLTHARNADGGLALNLTPMDAPTLRHELERAARWMRDGKDDLMPVPPPDTVCNDICAMPDYPGFPQLARVITAPSVSAQGHVIDKPGFDPASGIFYHQAEPLKIPDTSPTADRVKWALDLIVGQWLQDFPFDQDCPPAIEGAASSESSSRAHALALFLLPFARELVDGSTPLHFVSAPTQRTGKSLLVEIAGGVFDPLISPGAAPEGRDNDAEWRKKITSALQTESPFVWIDNIKGLVDTGALEAALTSRFWSDRALGSHKQVTLKNNKVWVFTGNNQ